MSERTLGCFRFLRLVPGPKLPSRRSSRTQSNASAYRQQGTPHCVLHEAAVANADGEVRFAYDMGSGSHVASASESRVLTVPTIDLFPYLRRADLAKIDIEGAEWPILADPRLADLSSLVIVFEYHRVGAPSLPARDAADGILRAAGFATSDGSSNYWGHGILGLEMNANVSMHCLERIRTVRRWLCRETGAHVDRGHPPRGTQRIQRLCMRRRPTPYDTPPRRKHKPARTRAPVPRWVCLKWLYGIWPGKNPGKVDEVIVRYMIPTIRRTAPRIANTAASMKQSLVLDSAIECSPGEFSGPPQLQIPLTERGRLHSITLDHEVRY